VVLDGRFDAARSAEVARLIARLGLDGVWLRQPALTGPGPADPAALLSRLRADAAPALAGMIVDTDAAGASLADAIARAEAGDAAEPGDAADAGDAGEHGDAAEPGGAAEAGGLRIALTGSLAGQARWLGLIADRPHLRAEIALPAAAGQASATMAAMPPAPGAPGAPRAPRVPGAVLVPFAAGRDLDQAITDAAGLAADLPVLAEVAVSVGRTTAEARARAEAEDLFAIVGQPAQGGLFGTLEECQAGAARLAHAGATELVCYLPHAGDLADVLAQLRAIAVGAAMLRPGEPPSPPPPPPVGWGGRRAVP
jgi:hypothetical protein